MTKKKTNTPKKTAMAVAPSVPPAVKATKNKQESSNDTTLTTTVTIATTAATNGKVDNRRKRDRDQQETRNKLLEQDKELAQGIFGAAVGIDMKSDEEIDTEEDSEDDEEQLENSSDSEVAADSNDETDSEGGFYEGSDDDVDDNEEELDNDDELTPSGLDPALNPLRGTIWPEIDATLDSDSETEQAGYNTVGKIPMEWYKDMPHIGYDLDGKRIMKSAVLDELDKFLANVDDPNTWKTVRDELEQQDVILSPEELQIIQRMQQGQFPDANYDPYEVNRIVFIL
jgi:ribosome biogenesis protein ERB1